MEWVEEALEIALRAIDNENFHDNNNNDDQSCTTKMNNLKIYQNHINDEDKIIDDMKMNEKCTTTKNIIKNLNNSKENFESIYENLNEMIIISNKKIEQNEIESSTSSSSSSSSSSTTTTTTTTDMSKNQIHLDEKQIIQTKNQNVKNYSDDHHQHDGNVVNQNGNVAKHANHEAKIEELKSELEQKENYVDNEQYYQVPKSSEPLYEVPKFQKPIPVYENIEIFYSDLTTIVNGNIINGINNEENQIEIENYHQLNGLVTTSSTPTSPSSSSSSMLLQPPKEKPPPPPIEEISDNENEIESITQNKTDALSSLSTSSSLSPIKQDNTNQQQQKSLNNLKITEESINIFENVGSKQNSIKRMNSTKRIKKELRNKRSSFLGIEGNDDDIFLELTVAPPPDMAQLLQEERRLEKQLYMKAGLYDSSDTGESRDSGVSENHSRQSSEPFTNSSEEHEDLLMKKEKEIIEVLEKEEKKQRISSENWSKQDENDAKIQCIENQIREQEEVLRVERELLQLEQEELKRQRENLMIRENMARRELEHGAKMLMSATNNHNRSLQDINNASTTTTTTNHYANIPNQIYRVEADYRKSMSDLPSDLLFNSKRIPPTPPAKPLRSNLSIDSRILNANGNTNNNKNNNTVVGLIKIANVGNNQMMTGSSGRIQHSQSTDEFVPLRNYQPSSALHHGNMTRHTLHALSATPKPKYTDGWVQATIKNKSSSDKCVDNWLSYQQKRKSIPDGFNYNKHWLIQEAEQRRIDQQRGLRSSSISISTNSINGWANTNSNSAIQRNGSITNDKPLPDAVIETITQRVQSKGLGERKRLDQTPPPPPIPAMAASDSLLTTVTAAAPPPPPPPPPAPASATTEVGQQDKILSVSGKKKCSHCGEELGRGAAMIIESLRLFYHINCFKCCVCHVQLGDGLNGTDVRVRNHKLHCHNCYSSDDGIKFSCV